MTGWRDVRRLRNFEDQCSEIGLKIGAPQHSYNEDVISLYPADDRLPVYRREAELFTGTIESAEVWLRGSQWMLQYLKMLKVADDSKIQRKEQDIVNQQLLERIKK